MLLNTTIALAFVFSDWVRTHSKAYSSAEEYAYRKGVYEANLELIDAHNRGNHTWSMSINKFADMTASEFRARYVGGYNDAYVPKNYKMAGLRTTLPASVDWVSAGAVGPVKNQEQCGSCWSFSSTGALEGAWYIAKGELVSLSEQQLIDCSTAEGNQGCNGGMMDYAFQYVISNGGITCESDYPYSATGPNACQAKGKPICAKITSYTDVVPNSDQALMSALVKQPVSIAIEADQAVFQFYSGGVMSSPCGTALDHGVLAVGYGTVDGADYYKVKNSWGPDWGVGATLCLVVGLLMRQMDNVVY